MMAFGISVFVLFLILLCYSFGTKMSDECSSGGGNSYIGSSKGGKNNPGYLIHTDVTWQGKDDSDGCKFENFISLAFGVRAWYVNLFGKVNKGTINNTDMMIDVLTPAGSENSEIARNNYKASVSQATNWLELGTAVFNFEANPDWLNSSEKQSALEQGFRDAVIYCYSGKVPQYFK